MAKEERVFGAGIVVDRHGEHTAAVVEVRLRAVAMVVVDIEHRFSLGSAVAQGRRGQRGVVREAVAAEAVGPGVVAGRAHRPHRRVRRTGVSGVGRIEPDRLGPRLLGDVQIPRHVGPRQSRVQAVVEGEGEGAVVRWVSQRARTLPQRGLHGPGAALFRGKETAAENLVAARVQVV